MKTLWSLGPIYPLVVPCFHFQKVVDANAYIANLRGKLTPKQFDRVFTHKVGSETFISVPRWQEGVFGRLQDHLVFLATQQDERVYEVEFGYSPSHPFFVPRGAKVTFLALQGTHKYTKAAPKLPEGLAWLQKVLTGPKDAANACLTPNGDDLRTLLIPQGESKQPYPFTVFVGPEVRMTFVSHELLYNTYSSKTEEIGLPNGCLSYVYFITFTTKKTKGGGVFRIFCKWLTGRSGDPERPDPPEVVGMDPVWSRLYDRACRRFAKRCVPYSRENEPERLLQRQVLEHSSFLTRHRELVALAATDKDSLENWIQTYKALGGPNSLSRRLRMGRALLAHMSERFLDHLKGTRGVFFSYRARVRALGWDDALATVEFPWQLWIVFQEHLWEKGRMVSLEDTRSLFMQLLEVHPCSNERRIELWEMAETYIAPQDPLWEAEEHP